MVLSAYQAAACFCITEFGLCQLPAYRLSSDTSTGLDSIQYVSYAGSSGDEEAVVDQLDRVMEVMMSNPAMQEMMLSRMPPHMRRPEVLKAMMANPEVRQRIATLAQQSVGIMSDSHAAAAARVP